MRLYRFRGHSSGLDLGATVARLPALAQQDDAEATLARALDHWAETRRADILADIDRLLDEWAQEAKAVRFTKVRRPRSARLAAIPQELADAARVVPDASAIVGQVIPRGLVRRLAWGQPEAAVKRQGLDALRRTLERRLDPALARAVGRDAVLAEVVATLG